MRNFYDNAKFATLVPLFLSGCMAGPSSQVSNSEPGNSNVAQSQARSNQAAGSAGGRTGSAMHSMGTMKGMDHSSMSGMEGRDHSPHRKEGGHGASAAGRPGTPAQASRTVYVTGLDTMRFDPQTMRIQVGETIRFVVTNKGKLPHEFVIGMPQEQKQHAEMMQKTPGMKHEEENAISLAPGETKTLVWQFDQPGVVEAACHIPGHYESGMVSKVLVGSGDK